MNFGQSDSRRSPIRHWNSWSRASSSKRIISTGQPAERISWADPAGPYLLRRHLPGRSCPATTTRPGRLITTTLSITITTIRTIRALSPAAAIRRRLLILPPDSRRRPSLPPPSDHSSNSRNRPAASTAFHRAPPTLRWKIPALPWPSPRSATTKEVNQF